MVLCYQSVTLASHCFFPSSNNNYKTNWWHTCFRRVELIRFNKFVSFAWNCYCFALCLIYVFYFSNRLLLFQPFGSVCCGLCIKMLDAKRNSDRLLINTFCHCLSSDVEEGDAVTTPAATTAQGSNLACNFQLAVLALWLVVIINTVILAWGL